jgi:N,N'-diacetylchitobiose transport system substrate-binding protein
VFLGGSVLAIPTNSAHQGLAVDLLKIMASASYQQKMAEAGLIPALKSQLDTVTGSEAAVAQAAAAQNSRFVPTSEKWAGVEAANVLPDMLVQIAQGTPIAEAAGQADAAIEAALNG